MKILNGKIGLMVRLSAVITALLFGQQALAVGTAADTDILNEVQVNYNVGTVAQTELTDSVTFKVDRRVDFTLVPVSTNDLEGVTPGENDAWVDFLLTNTSNATLDFLLDAVNTAAGNAVDGSGSDDADMNNVEWAVVTAGDPTPTQGQAQFVDELAADASVRIRVWGDADVLMTVGQIAGVDLTATAKLGGTVDPGGALNPANVGADLAYGVADGPLTVENVDPNGDDGVRVSVDGFIVEDADLSVTKTNTIVGGGPAIPGAVVEYTISIVNAGTAAASNIAITDTVMSELTLVLGAYAGPPAASDFQINNNGAASGCTAAADADDCVLAGAVLTFDNLTLAAPVSPATSTTLTITFRATIRGTGAT